MEENKNKAIKAEQQNDVLFHDACLIIDQAQAYAYRFLEGKWRDCKRSDNFVRSAFKI